MKPRLFARAGSDPIVRMANDSPGPAAVFVSGGNKAEEQLRPGFIERRELELIDEDQVVAQYGVDQLADGVVGETAVQRLDQIGSDEVAHAETTLDGAIADANQAVALARTGR